MTKTGVGFAYVFYLISVGQMAYAGAWEEFVSRCLVPMENFELVQPSDLTVSKSFKNDGDTYSNYHFADGAHVLSISDGNGPNGHWCTLGIEKASEEVLAGLSNEFLTWSAAAIAADRYDEVAANDGALVLHSFEWREPQLRVVMMMLSSGPGIFFSAEDTDLEG